MAILSLLLNNSIQSYLCNFSQEKYYAPEHTIYGLWLLQPALNNKMIALKNFNTFHKANVKKQIMGINIHTHLKHQKYHLPYLMFLTEKDHISKYVSIDHEWYYSSIIQVYQNECKVCCNKFLENKPMLVTFLLGLSSIFHSYRMLLFLRSQIATIFCKIRQIEALAFFHVVSLIKLIRCHFIIQIYCLSTFHSTA